MAAFLLSASNPPDKDAEAMLHVHPAEEISAPEHFPGFTEPLPGKKTHLT